LGEAEREQSHQYHGGRPDLCHGESNEELQQQAASPEGATMPDGQKYEEWVESKGRGQ
jgi:hypothetical protein